MNDLDLKKLANLQSPPVDEMARTRAINSARLTFEASAQDAGKEFSIATQGSEYKHRPTSTIKQLWSFVMNPLSKFEWNVGSAAFATASGVIVLPLVTLVAWNVKEHRAPEGAAPEPIADTR